MSRPTCPRFPQPRRSTAPTRGAVFGLILGAAVATVLVSPAGAASPSPITYWTKCSSHVKVAGVEVSPVEVLHVTCAQANHAIRRARILLTPGGPIFSTHGYTCSSTNILPRVDPSPVELPAAERCTGAQHRQLSFIWDWAS
jgi:hypothetical protein